MGPLVAMGGLAKINQGGIGGEMGEPTTEKGVVSTGDDIPDYTSINASLPTCAIHAYL